MLFVLRLPKSKHTKSRRVWKSNIIDNKTGHYRQECCVSEVDMSPEKKAALIGFHPFRAMTRTIVLFPARRGWGGGLWRRPLRSARPTLCLLAFPFQEPISEYTWGIISYCTHISHRGCRCAFWDFRPIFWPTTLGQNSFRHDNFVLRAYIGNPRGYHFPYSHTQHSRGASWSKYLYYYIWGFGEGCDMIYFSKMSDILPS